MAFFKFFGEKVPLNVPLDVASHKYTITFYTGGVDIDLWEQLTPKEQEEAFSKSWYIKWWFRSPVTGKMERQQNIKSGINRLKTKNQRMEFMRIYRRRMINAINERLDPSVNEIKIGINTVPDVVTVTARRALLDALEVKRQTIGSTTYNDYKSDINGFISFLEASGKDVVDIKDITRVDVSQHLNEVLKKTSARNRNNVRGSLSSIFSQLRDQFLIERNFIDTDIKKLKTASRTDRRFTLDQMRKLSDYLKKNDPHLLLYIKVVAYNFLRPIEVNRLTVSSIDLESQIMYFDQKTKIGKTKHIPDLYIEEFKKLIGEGLPRDFYLFTPNDRPGEWAATDNNKRDYFSKRFKKVKDELGIGAEYGLYSFRHTYITNTYIVLKSKGMAHLEAIQYLMRITGHTSEAGIKKYIHENDADRPDDWSDLLDFKL